MTHHFDTRLLHAGRPATSPETGVAPVNVPTVRTSTVRFASTEAYRDVFRRKAAGERIASYGRQGMDTHQALEDALCLIEGGERCFLAPSGVAAISFAMLGLLSPGDHVLVTDSVYGPVRKLDSSLLQRLGIEVTYFRPDAQDLSSLLRPNTRVIYAEAPGSLLFEMHDLPALAQVAHAHGALLVADNTWGTGYLYSALDMGADVSVVAATKYVAGHSDVMMGAVVTRDPALGKRLNDTYYALGLTVGADDASLALRGVRTLTVRLAQHAQHALTVARHLAAHPAVSRVYCPALPGDPGHALWQRDCRGTNGLLSFSLATADHARACRIVDALTLFGIGFSWGGYESLVQLVEPGDLTGHSAWQEGDRPLLRLHIGLEHPDDLIADLDRALAID